MSISGDYNLDSTEAFKDKFGDLSQVIDGDTVVKTVKVAIKFSTQQPGFFWGTTLKEKTCTIEKTYPMTISNIPSDTALLARFKATLEKSTAQTMDKLGIDSIREVMELLSTIEPDKYPTLLNGLFQLARGIDDKNLFELIKMYQSTITLFLPEGNLEKIEAALLFNLPLKSAAVQDLLLSIRQKLSESNPIDLFHQTRTHLLNVAPVIAQWLESKVEQEREQQETLQLPLDSEKIQLLIAPLRDKELKKIQEDEIAKVATCYKRAVWNMRATAGEKQLSSIDIKVVYTKRSNLNQDLVYEKKYSSAS